jgi:sarcosine oxidase subunit delta
MRASACAFAGTTYVLRSLPLTRAVSRTIVLLIPCPWCGPRNQIEFTYGGDARVQRPANDAPIAAWFAYVYLRDNPMGAHDELWLHSGGCRSWFKVRRDTRTHDIVASARIGEDLVEAPK